MGRIDEQQRFRSLLEDILNSSHRGLLRRSSSITSEWSHIVLLYGAGGMGKTTLSKRLRDIASGLPPDRRYHNKFTIMWLDWEVLREQDRRLAVRDAVTFEMILDHLYSAFCASGFMHEFNHFDQKRFHLSEVETHVDRMLNSHTEDGEGRYASLRKLGSEGLTMLVRKELPEVDAFFSQEEMVRAAEDILRVGTEGLGYLRSQANEWLRRRLQADDHDLFTFPQKNLARAFAQGVRAVTRSKPLVFFLLNGKLYLTRGVR